MKLLIPPPLQGLLCAGLIWSLAIYLPQFTIEIPFKRIISTIIFVAGITIDLMALRMFYHSGTTISPLSPEKTSHLVASGIYQYSRNPMYLGMALLLIGLSVWFGALLGIIIIAGFVGSITVFQIKPEEKILAEKFADAYLDYCKKVRRWI